MDLTLYLQCKIQFLAGITSPDVMPSSDMQIDPLRIDIDLSRFVLVGQAFFVLVENVFFCRDNLIGECRG